MNYKIAVTRAKKKITSGSIPQGGVNPEGLRLDINNYYLEKNKKPFFAVSGEFHFTRYDERFWDAELSKIAAGGVNILSTYVFWNHHEEVKGVFDWSGNKNLRKFVQLCAKNNLWVIVRCGPFCHGEVRNGGVPDWLYGSPFELRSNSPEYLSLVRHLYAQISAQLTGLYFKDGGPILGAQIENEYMHSAAPWEMTTGISNEWLPGGKDGDSHILTLKKIAQEEGIITPFYTCTGWGGAATPVPEVLPLWGGYSFQPWLFYGDVKEHPATPEYIFRDLHNNAIPRNYNFEPKYKPEDYPYACCEMGGGMQVFYQYRFKIIPQAVTAMAVVKAAGGCNFLGYYMYHGGTNPRGKVTPFLNEHGVPKMSYDYQAPLGEFGVPKGQYHGLRLLHYFFETFEEVFCPSKTFLPEKAAEIEPKDNNTIRWAVRSLEDSGFLFINNYQDHWETKDHQDIHFELNFEKQILNIPANKGMIIPKNSTCILPFNFDLPGCRIVYATAQLITKTQQNKDTHWFFLIPQGMNGEISLEAKNISQLYLENFQKQANQKDQMIFECTSSQGLISFINDKNEKQILWFLSEEDAQKFWKLKIQDREYIFFTNAQSLYHLNNGQQTLNFETLGEVNLEIQSFPPLPDKFNNLKTNKSNFLTSYLVPRKSEERPFIIERVTPLKVIIKLSKECFYHVNQLFLRVEYTGDIGNCYLNSQLIADDFSNGLPWDIELTRHQDEILSHGLVLDIIPLRQGSQVISDTTMAGRFETEGTQVGEISKLSLIPQYSETFTWDN